MLLRLQVFQNSRKVWGQLLWEGLMLSMEAQGEKIMHLSLLLEIDSIPIEESSIPFQP